MLSRHHETQIRTAMLRFMMHVECTDRKKIFGARKFLTFVSIALPRKAYAGDKQSQTKNKEKTKRP